MLIAKQSTARTVTVGPVLDADGVAVTDRVVGNFKIAKNGGAPAALNASATLTHRNTGHYSLALTASDLDTVGQAEIVIDDTTNACPVKEITVVEEVIYDALFAASANAFSGAAGATTLTALAAGSVTAAVIADGAIDAATFAADVDAEILSYLVDDDTRIDASAVNALPTATAIATAVLRSPWSDHEDAADPLSLAALIPAAFQWSLTAHAGKLTTYKSDGTTEFHQYTLTSAAGTEAITVLSN